MPFLDFSLRTVTAMSAIPTLFYTLNCGKVAPLCDDLTNSLLHLLPTYEEAADPDSPAVVPELIVVGFQELSNNIDGTRYSTINGLLIQIADEITDAISKRFSARFTTVSMNHLGSIAQILISAHSSRFKVMKSVDPPVGYFYTSVKGGTGLRVQYTNEDESTEMTFVTLHLNPGSTLNDLTRRNHDFISILKGMKFPDGYSVLKPNNHCFMMGDYNYRATGGFYTDIGHDRPGEEEPIMIDGFDLSQDEMTIIRTKEKMGILTLFDEAQVKFAPTYKLVRGSLTYDGKRTPSWCDRILYLPYSDAQQEDYKITKYDSVSDLIISDHVPVYLLVDIPMETPESVINSSGYLVDRSTKLADTTMQMKPARRYEIYRRVGAGTDAIFGTALYLTTTRRGRFLLVGIVVLICLIYMYI